MARFFAVIVALIGVSTMSALQSYPCKCPTGIACISRNCTCAFETQVIQDNNCVFPAGEQCNAKHTCVDGATCNRNTGTCECNKDRMEQKNTGLCLQLENGPCTTSNDCADNQGLSCLMDANGPRSLGKCTCTNFGYPGICFKTYGSSCTLTSQCTHWGSNRELQCVDNVCSCPWGKSYKLIAAPLTSYAIGECKIPNNRRCKPESKYECATDRCDSNYRCSCGNGATYNANQMTCVCQNGEIYNWQYQRCICYGKNFGQSACACPGDLVPDTNSWSCSCPSGAIQMLDNACMCRVPAVMNPVTKMCENN